MKDGQDSTFGDIRVFLSKRLELQLIFLTPRRAGTLQDGKAEEETDQPPVERYNPTRVG
jgi:hypothetical protein